MLQTLTTISAFLSVLFLFVCLFVCFLYKGGQIIYKISKSRIFLYDDRVLGALLTRLCSLSRKEVKMVFVICRTRHVLKN